MKDSDNDIVVHIPQHNSSEVKYVLDVLLTDCLGLRIKVEEEEKTEDFHLKVGGKELIIKNIFFANAELPEVYQESNIPSSVGNGEYKTREKVYPFIIIYGNDKIESKDKSIIWYCDVVGASFFMLSRWEEYALKIRDKHARFSGKNSLASRFSFLHRPIINEYLEILKQLLRRVGFTEHFKSRSFKLIPTHDIDFLHKWRRPREKYLSLLKAASNFNKDELTFCLKHLFLSKDPYDTFNRIMQLSEDKGVSSHFFVMSKFDKKMGSNYWLDEPKLQSTLREIKERGHKIGLHPSYDSCLSFDKILQEKEDLEDVLEDEIDFSRQHYLQFSVPFTWRFLDLAGIKYDSTMSYATNCGFRCGICYPFKVYDILQRKTLDLYERPLIVMEVTLFNYNKFSVSQAIDKITQLKEEVRKYHGEFIFLWHNSSFGVPYWKDKEVALQCMYNA